MTNRRHPHVNADALERELLEMSAQHRVAYCSAISQRLLPSYRAFRQDSGWGDPAVLEHGLERAWSFAVSGDADASEFRLLRLDCLDQAPDTGQHGSDFTSAALDAANAVSESLACALDGAVAHCVEVSTYAADTIDMYLQITREVQPDQRLNERMANHPLMVRELEHQAADLALLHATPAISETVVDILRSGARWVLEDDQT